MIDSLANIGSSSSVSGSLYIKNEIMFTDIISAKAILKTIFLSCLKTIFIVANYRRL